MQFEWLGDVGFCLAFFIPFLFYLVVCLRVPMLKRLNEPAAHGVNGESGCGAGVSFITGSKLRQRRFKAMGSEAVKLSVSSTPGHAGFCCATIDDRVCVINKS